MNRARHENWVGAHRVAIVRGTGCLWLVLAGWALLFLATVGAVVPIDATPFLLPLVVLPLHFAALMFARGGHRLAAATSAVAAASYAALGVWNFFRTAEFERNNPGAWEVSGGFTSVLFVLIALAAALSSLSVALGASVDE